MSTESPARVVGSMLLWGRCIAALRRDRRLTQAQLAAAMGVSRPAVTHIETGRTAPTLRGILQLGEVFRQAPGFHALTLHHLAALTERRLAQLGVAVVHRDTAVEEPTIAVEALDRAVAHSFERLGRYPAPVLESPTFSEEPS